MSADDDHRLTRDEARRIAANTAKHPVLLRRSLVRLSRSLPLERLGGNRTLWRGADH